MPTPKRTPPRTPRRTPTGKRGARKIVRRGPALFIDLVRRYKVLKGEVDSLKLEQEEVRAKLTDYLINNTTDDNRTVKLTDDEGELYTATLVQGETPEIDWEGLHLVLDEEKWKAIQIEVPSAERLEDLVGQGQISGEVVQQHIHMKPKKPYPKVS